ncbi:MAG: DinB family protein [Acidobacteria bacterium]|nr:DinB family protein [Acidobacteriota bacterium]
MIHVDLRRLFEHMWWADAEVLGALRRAVAAPARVLEIYAHVVGAELVWLDRIEGAEQSVAVWPEASLESCGALSERARLRYQSFLDGVRAEDLDRLIHYTNSAGRAFDTRLDDILVHVALHGMNHRGQVSILLRDAGAEPAPTDYIGWVRGAPAATRS